MPAPDDARPDDARLLIERGRLLLDLRAVAPDDDERLAAAFPALFAEMRAQFGLTVDDLPQPPARRKGRVA